MPGRKVELLVLFQSLMQALFDPPMSAITSTGASPIPSRPTPSQMDHASSLSPSRDVKYRAIASLKAFPKRAPAPLCNPVSYAHLARPLNVVDALTPRPRAPFLCARVRSFSRGFPLQCTTRLDDSTSTSSPTGKCWTVYWHPQEDGNADGRLWVVSAHSRPVCTFRARRVWICVHASNVDHEPRIDNKQLECQQCSPHCSGFGQL